MTKSSPNAWNAAMREELRNSDLVPFLLSVVRGEKIPERDERGRIVAWTDPPDLGMRVSTAQALLRKIAPDVSAQQLDITGNGEGGPLQIVLGIAPPASQDPGDDAKVVEHEPTQVEHKEHARFDDPPEGKVRTRTRTKAHTDG